MNGIAQIYDILGERKTAAAYYLKAIPLLVKPTGYLMTQRNLGILAGIYVKLKKYENARNVLKQQLDYLTKVGLTPAIPPTVAMLAMVEGYLGHSDEALKWYREELRLTEASGDTLGNAGTLSSIAEIEEEKGSLDEAEADLKRSVGMLETVRTSLRGLSEAKSTFLAANISTYRQYLALLLRRGKTEEAFGLAQKMKARGLADILTDGKVQLSGSLTPEEREQERALRQKSDALNYQLVKEGVQNEIGSKKRSEAIKVQIDETERELQVLENRLYTLHPGLAEKRAAVTIALADVAKFLPEDTALLEYLMLRVGKTDEVALFVVTQHGGKPLLSVHRIPIGEQALRPRLEALNAACSDPRKEYRAAAAEMYRVLVAPAQAELARIKRLIVCPDGPLWDTPFAALVMKGVCRGRIGQTAPFLIDRFEIDYAYSATGAAAALAEHTRAGRRPPATSMLAFADPAFGDEKRFGDNPDIPGQRPINAASRPISAASRQGGKATRPLNAASRPLSAASRPLNAASRPINAASRRLKSGDRPINAASRPINAASRHVKSGDRPINAASRPINAASRPILAASRPINAASRSVLLPRRRHALAGCRHAAGGEGDRRRFPERPRLHRRGGAGGRRQARGREIPVPPLRHARLLQRRRAPALGDRAGAPGQGQRRRRLPDRPRDLRPRPERGHGRPLRLQHRARREAQRRGHHRADLGALRRRRAHAGRLAMVGQRREHSRADAALLRQPHQEEDAQRRRPPPGHPLRPKRECLRQSKTYNPKFQMVPSLLLGAIYSHG